MTPYEQQPTDVYLVRHGETAEEFRGRCYGSLDVPLSTAGLAQVSRLGDAMKKCRLTAIYCSPSSRCVQTAEVIASHHSCGVAITGEFAELNFGEFEGKSYRDIEMKDPALYDAWMQCPTQVQFPGGENFPQMCERVLGAVQRLRQKHAGGGIVIVAHGGVNRIILADALGAPLANIFRFGQRYAALNMVRYYGEYAVVELMNGCLRNQI